VSAPRRPGRWKVWTRTVHLYASLLGLVLCGFFGATGFVLNHEDWFESEPVRRSEDAVLPAEVMAELEPLAVVESVRAAFALAGGLTAYESDPGELRLSFSRPGETSDVVIALADGRATLEQEREGTLAALTDLHKGKRSGALGKRLVDATSLLLLTISISGFVLWLTLPKRRRPGLVALGFSLGLVVIALGYVFR